MEITYRPNGVVMPVEDLEAMSRQYIDGLGSIRGMEEMIQDIATRVREVVRVPVRARAHLIIAPPFGGQEQIMKVAVRVK